MHEKVSVIIPVYNQELYLTDCISSIINQTYKNLEIIIVDDGSTDSSSDIIKKFCAEDNRIVFVEKKNTGVSDTRNIGVSKSSGDYLMFVDSDDWIELDTIEKLLLKIKLENVDVIRYNDIVYDKYENKKLDDFYELSDKKLIDNDMEKIYKYIFSANKNIACYSPTLFMKKNVVPMFDVKLKYMEDMVFYIDLISNINSIYFYNEHLYNYRYNGKSVTKNYNKQLDNIFNQIDSIKVIKNKLGEKYHNILNQLAFTLSIGKMDLYLYGSKESNFVKKRKILNVIKNENYESISFKFNPNNLSIDKKIEYYLLKKNKIYMFIFLEKIKKLIKK